MTDLTCKFCAAPADVIYAGQSAPGQCFKVRCNHAITCPMRVEGWPTAPDAVDAWSGVQIAKET